MVAFRKLSKAIAAVSVIHLLVLACSMVPSYAQDENNELLSRYEQIRIIDARLRSLGVEIERAMADLSSKEEEITDNADKLNRAKIELADLRGIYNKRIVRIYQCGDIEPVQVFLNAKDFNGLLTATKMLIIIGEHDARLLKRMARLESEIKVRQARLQIAAIQQKKLIGDLESTKQRLTEALIEQQDALAKFTEGYAPLVLSDTVTANGFIFPVAFPYTYVDSWGAPRMVGTSYAHSHEGTDIIALPWTHTLAIENGVISKMGNNTLGGISLWLNGDSGNKYYYAHLYGYAEGLSVGQRVMAGQIIGYIGDTGNAKGTPHLHFQVHPGGKEAVNPYDFLISIDPMRRLPVSGN